MADSPAYGRASGYLWGWSKRCFDVAVCLLLLPPAVIVMAVVGLAILMRDGRPILFVQSRIGRNGIPFRVPKLRTLRVDVSTHSPSAGYDTAAHVTSMGRLLRRYKLDELPQLFTVLSGQMSLVGPRPELPDIVATYNSFQRRRLLMKPGLTGPWQVLANHKTPIHEYLKYDLYYLRRASLWLDLKLLVLTIPSIMRPHLERPRVKLAYILSTFPCRSELFAAREITALRKQGFAIVVFAAVGEDVPASLHVPSRVVYRPRLFSLGALYGLVYMLVRHPGGLLRLLRLLITLLKESPREAKTVAGNLYTIGVFARACDREGLRHIHAYFLDRPACIGLAVAAVTGASFSIAAHARDVFVECGALRLKAARARFITTCTRQAAQHLKSRLPAVCHEKIFLCYHGVEVPRAPQRAPGGKSAAANDGYVLACVARLVPKKGHTDLVRAMALVTAQLPRCRLVMVGSGAEQPRVQRLVSQLGLARSVEWKGWQAPDATRDLIETADVLVVPSVVAPDGDRDGIPNVILEAFAAGTPVVATRLEGITEAVEDGYNGLVVEPGDIIGMARAIEEVLVNRPLRTALSRAAGRTVTQRFDIEENTRQLGELFKRSCLNA